MPNDSGEPEQGKMMKETLHKEEFHNFAWEPTIKSCHHHYVLASLTSHLPQVTVALLYNTTLPGA